MHLGRQQKNEKKIDKKKKPNILTVVKLVSKMFIMEPEYSKYRGLPQKEESRVQNIS